jgi:hypothetical protein
MKQERFVVISLGEREPTVFDCSSGRHEQLLHSPKYGSQASAI